MRLLRTSALLNGSIHRFHGLQFFLVFYVQFFLTDNMQKGASVKKGSKIFSKEAPCANGVVVIAISLFPEVPGSIPERGK